MTFIKALILSLAFAGAANAGFIPEDPPEVSLSAASAAKAAPAPIAAPSAVEAASQPAPAPAKVRAKRPLPVKR